MLFPYISQEADADPALQEVVQDAADVLERLEEDTLNSHSLPVLIDHLKQQGRSGARLHRPLRCDRCSETTGAPLRKMLFELLKHQTTWLQRGKTPKQSETHHDMGCEN